LSWDFIIDLNISIMSQSCFRLFIKGPIGRSKESFLLIIIFLLLGGNAQTQQGLKAEYYDGPNFNRLVSVKYVENIDEYWNDRPPVPGINPHSCSIRWRGKLKPGKSGTYKFSARVDDGIRVWVDNRLIIDQWELNDVGVFQSTVDLVAHRDYDLKVEYFNALIEGEVRLLWKIPTEEKTWYERIFGDDNSHTVIAPEYFFRPDEFNQKKDDFTVSINNEEGNAPPPKDAPIAQVKKTNFVKKKERNNSRVQATKVQKRDASKTVVTAKEIEKYIPKNIAFERAKVKILESSNKELNLFAEFMLDQPQLTVVIEGHTDPVGDAEMNLQLSKQRAYKVASYLVEKGVDSKRIKAEGLGGSKPLVMPVEGNYYPANRRVVFIVSGLE
jgi:outer membrane protein OmpA-like peptidoglycan-associated protein